MVRRLIDQNRRREVRRQGLLLDRLERKFTGKLRVEIARAMREMIRVYELTGEVPAARDHTDNLTSVFQSLAVASATTFGARVIGQGKDAGYVLETKDFAGTMARLALSYVASEMIRRRITSISDTTRAQIVAAVARGYADGLGVAGIAAAIDANVGTISRSRAALIARTETHGAANFGAMNAAQETGIRLKREWLAAHDARTRDTHAEADGQIVGQDEPFDIGGYAMMYPGDPAGPAEETINCRCALGFVVD